MMRGSTCCRAQALPASSSTLNTINVNFMVTETTKQNLFFDDFQLRVFPFASCFPFNETCAIINFEGAGCQSMHNKIQKFLTSHKSRQSLNHNNNTNNNNNNNNTTVAKITMLRMDAEDFERAQGTLRTLKKKMRVKKQVCHTLSTLE